MPSEGSSSDNPSCVENAMEVVSRFQLAATRKRLQTPAERKKALQSVVNPRSELYVLE